jgi:cation-transporting ATPase I
MPGRRETEEPPHPADSGPITRAVVEIAADALGLLLAIALRTAGAKPLPIEIDFAALLSLLENVPLLRRALEHRFGRATTEVVITVLSAVDSGLIQGFGPLVDMALESIRLRAFRERRRAFESRARDLGDRLDRTAHPPRTEPLEPGPTGRYERSAVPASLAAFLVGLVRVRKIESAAALIFGGVPKPTRCGREAFSAHVAYRLGKRRAIVLDPEALEDLESIDVLVLSEAMSAASRTIAFHRLVEEAKAVIRVFIVREGEPSTDLIRRLQGQGRGVAFFGPGPESSFLAADLSVWIRSEGTRQDRSPARGAHVLACDGIDDARVLIGAIAAAKRAAGQSVIMALAEAGTTLVLLAGGLSLRTTRRVMGIANIAALASVGNGIRLARSATRDPRPVPKDMPSWHALEVEAVLRLLGSNISGLDDAEIAPRKVPMPPVPTMIEELIRLVGEELDNPLTPVLAIGAGISAIVGSILDGGLIGGVLAINSLIGASQRLRVEGTLRRLEHGQREKHRVRRGARVVEVLGSELVPGDVLELEAGEVVPADSRILSARALEVDESALTGESLPGPKAEAPVGASAPVAERGSMLYAGTSIAAGSGDAVVVAVNGDTEMRRALIDAEDKPRASGVEKRLESLARMTVPVAGASGLAVALSGLLRRADPTEVLNAGVNLALSSVPEGLPIVATLAQLAAAERLSKRGAFTRNPRALETLGRVTVLCADKTGTLTEGRIRLLEVSDGEVNEKAGALGPRSRAILRAALRASPQPNGTPLFHLTDRALIEGAEEEHVTLSSGAGRWTRVDEVPFESGRGYHATRGETSAGRLLSVKGAPEVVLARSTKRKRPDGSVTVLSDEERGALALAASRVAERGLRVLAVAERSPFSSLELSDEAIGDLEFLGFVSFADRIRATAKKAVSDLVHAGVEIMMLTGDHPATADAIAEAIGVKDGDVKVMTGPELDRLDDAALARAIEETPVFARVTPQQKVRIVRALQRCGEVVAMTGDGANDAPAIRLADVGIALGDGSADATRQAADIIVTDARIETIVDAVLEGRALWASVREAIALLVGGNLGEIGFTLIGSLIDGRSPLTPRQLLLLNLLTDALPATAIALRPPPDRSAEDLLHEGPEASLGRALTHQIVWRGVLTAGASIGAWLAARMSSTRTQAKSIALLSLTGAQLGQTIVAGRYSGWAIASSLGSMAALVGILETPGLSRFFGSTTVDLLGLAQAGAAAGVATALSVVGPRLVSASKVSRTPRAVYRRVSRIARRVRCRIPRFGSSRS